MSVQRRWLAPQSLDEAVALWDPETTVVGGGAALASAAFPCAAGPRLLDLFDTGLDSFELPRIGAMVTLARMLESEDLASGWPAVWQAAAASGHAGVRRLATIGGTVAARLPGADLLSALCAHGASVTVCDKQGSHTRSLATALLEPLVGIVTEVRLGPPAPSAYRRAAARSGFAPAIAGVAGVRRDQASGPELWAGAVGPVPLRLDPTALPAEAELIGDERCSAWYRRQLLGVLRDEVLDALAEPVDSQQ